MSHTITITGKKGKVLSKLKMPKNIRVAQVSWSPTGDVDEVSFQFNEIEADVHELEAELERRVGFVLNDEHEEYEDEGDDAA